MLLGNTIRRKLRVYEAPMCDAETMYRLPAWSRVAGKRPKVFVRRSQVGAAGRTLQLVTQERPKEGETWTKHMVTI